MKNRLLLLVLTTLLINTPAHCINWQKNFGHAKSLATKSGRLIMIDFYTDWCGYCKKLDQTTYLDATVNQAATKIVAVKVDAEREGRQLATKYEVGSFPTMIFIHPDGTEYGRITGYVSPAYFISDLQKSLKTSKEVGALDTKVTKQQADLASITKLAAFYADHNSPNSLRLLQLAERMDPTNLSGKMGYVWQRTGVAFAKQSQLDRGIVFFRKTLKYSKMPIELANAHYSIGLCDSIKKNKKGAISEMRMASAIAGCPLELKQHAESLIANWQKPR